MLEFYAKSKKETEALGKTIGKELRGGEILALSGELGTGKTTFTRGLARGLGIREKIKSPTFVIMQAYQPKRGRALFHLDLYRLRSAIELEELGIKEVLNRQKNIVVIEWPEKAKSHLPKRTVHLDFSHPKNKSGRIIKIR